MKSNSDVSLFVDSISKLSEDINKNYTPDDIKPEEIKSEAEQLFDAAFADNTGTKKVDCKFVNFFNSRKNSSNIRICSRTLDIPSKILQLYRSVQCYTVSNWRQCKALYNRTVMCKNWHPE